MNTSMSDLTVSMEAIRYSDWYKRRGIRRLEELKQLKLINDESFELPRESIVHYLTTNVNDLGITKNNFLIRQTEAFVGVEHVKQYSTDEGSPIRLALDPGVLARKYKSANRDIRPIIKFESVAKNPENVIVANYAFLNQLYRYRDTYLTNYYRFSNLANTLVDEINRYAEMSNRHQFVPLSLPEQVPTLSQFKMVSSKMTAASLAAFTQNSALFILEIYKWISDDREQSIFSRLTDEAIKRVNFVFNESGKSSILNLANLDAWRRSETNTDGAFSPVQLNTVFLAFVRSMSAIRLIGKEDVNSIDISDEISQAELEGIDGVVDNEPEYDEDGELIEDDIVDDAPEDYESVFGRSVTNDFVSGVDTEKEVVKDILPQLRQRITNGEITEKQAKRYIQLLEKSYEIKDPFGGTGTIGDILASHDETINKLSKTKIPDKKTVTDKSMLESRLPNITKDYINEKYQSDIVAMVHSFQRDGYIIRDWTIDPVKDVNNDVEFHSIRIEPIGGEPSVIKFPVARIREDGTYYIGGVKYYLRKGRRDVPIRKVKPWKTFLTSYKSKLPLIRSQKVVDNYAGWLAKTMMKLSNNPDHILTVLEERSVFDHQLKLPRFYAQMSKGIAELSYKGINYNFSYEAQVKKHGQEVIDAFLKDGEMVIGNRGKTFFVVNDSGVVRSTTGDGDLGKVLGTFLDLVDVPIELQLKAPVDKVSITVLGKKIPICALVAYRFGLEPLINALQLTVRRVPKGKRLAMTADEYAVKFASDTLVLRRDEYLGQLIIGSLNQAKDAIKHFELEDFNTRDEVWADILQMMGYGPRIFREFDSLYNSWLDPITIQTLRLMGEPVKFRPLLIRGVETLATEYHNREMAGSGFLTKGYERIPGYIYNALTNSAQTHKARRSGSRIEMNPNEIWSRMELDTSKQICEDSNPIQFLKEQSNITHSGTGGQTSRTMVKSKREFDIDDLGLISEGGVDNGDVGVTAYLTYDPKVSNLLGMSETGKISIEDGPAKFQSGSFIVSPFADRDDYFLVPSTREGGMVT